MYKRITRNKEGEVVEIAILSEDGKILSMHVGNDEVLYEYDDKGNLIKVKNIFGPEASYEYDDQNRLIKTKRSDGEKYIYEYEEIKE